MKIRLGVNDTINEMLIGHLLAPMGEPTTKKVKKKKVRVVSPDKQKVEDAKEERKHRAEKVVAHHHEEKKVHDEHTRLKEAIMMAEIIGKPRCKTRHRNR